MIKRKQIYFHNPEKGSHGDCYRTCIACILEIEPVEVPKLFWVEYLVPSIATRKGVR